MSDKTKPQDSAAMPPASAGSHPVAWRAYADDGSETVHLFYEQARAAADEWNWSVEPLFRQPTLTDAEREAVERSADWLYRWQETHGYHSSENGDLATLRSLLERTR